MARRQFQFLCGAIFFSQGIASENILLAAIGLFFFAISLLISTEADRAERDDD